MTEMLERTTVSVPTARPADAPAYDLDDRFRTGAPATVVTGVQAIARLRAGGAS